MPWDQWAATIPDPPLTTKEWRDRVRYERDRAKALAMVAAGGPVCCAWCLEVDQDVLAFDHRYSNGADWKRQGISSGAGVVYAILSGTVPVDQAQILCANCNHRKKRIEARKRLIRTRPRVLDNRTSPVLYSEVGRGAPLPARSASSPEPATRTPSHAPLPLYDDGPES